MPLSALYTSAHKYLQPPIRFHCHYPPPVPPTFTPISHFSNFPRTAFIYFYWCRRVMAGESLRWSRNNPVTLSPFLLCSDPHLLSETSFTGLFTPWIWGQQPVEPTLLVSEQDTTDYMNLFDKWGYKTKKSLIDNICFTLCIRYLGLKGVAYLKCSCVAIVVWYSLFLHIFQRKPTIFTCFSCMPSVCRGL